MNGETITEEEAEARWLEEMLATCEIPEILSTELRESGPEIAELEGMFILFERTHSIQELLLITDLSPHDAPNHPTREPARIAVGNICNKLNTIKMETNIDSTEYEKLNAMYRVLSRAVGIINNGVVDHTR